MDCRTARSLLEAYLDGELDRDDARAIEAHAEACPECRPALEELDALRHGLRDPGLRHTAPAALRQRLEASGATQAGDSGPAAASFARRPRGRPQWLQTAAACALAFAIGGVSMQRWNAGHGSGDAAAQLERDVFAAHWRALAAASPVDVVSSDHHTVKPWFAGKVAQSPPVRDFTAQGFALAGGRIDYVGSERVAVLVYRHGRHLVDVFVLPRSAALPGTHAQADGYAADRITLGTQPAVVVSDLDPVERQRLARLLTTPQ